MINSPRAAQVGDRRSNLWRNDCDLTWLTFAAFGDEALVD
jgi:hypothetical protein